MSVGQRIKYLITLTADGNQRAFAKKMDISPQAINNLINKGGAPSFKLIQQIFKNFPELSYPWLILGEGDIGEAFLSQYIDKNSSHLQFVSEQQASYRRQDESLSLSKQRIASLEREVELLEKLIAEKDKVIEVLESKK